MDEHQAGVDEVKCGGGERISADIVLAHLDDSNYALAVVIANAPDAIRGYEEIKLRRLTETQELVAQHLARFTTSTRRGELATPR